MILSERGGEVVCSNCKHHFDTLAQCDAHRPTCVRYIDPLDAIVRRMPIMQPDYPRSPPHLIIRAEGPVVDQTPMSIGAIMATLQAINPRQALLVRLPNDVIDYIAPLHAACMKAVTRAQKRTAWRAWTKAIESLHKSMRASAQEAN